MRIDIPCEPISDLGLPAPLSRLPELAHNLWWSWNHRARALFERLDPGAWFKNRNPVELLLALPPDRIQAAADDPGFVLVLKDVLEELDEYLANEDTWYARNGQEEGPIAYFCAEYGLHESLPTYSGGLGVLAGDHCKAASDSGLPLIAVGLLYRRGYFHQQIDALGDQHEFYSDVEAERRPLRRALDGDGRAIVVSVPFPGHDVHAGVWVASVGRVPLLLLSTNVPENDPADRTITDLLYVADRETRFSQELILGVGGVRALAALGIEPRTWHINEGHAALLLYERAVREGGFDNLARNTVFTLHTPVPAGNEAFDPGLAARYLAPWSAALETDIEGLLDRGRSGFGDQQLNLSALAIRHSRCTTGVSEIHARISSETWAHLVPDREPAIGFVTNGVHLQTWMGRSIRAVLADEVGAWDGEDPAYFEAVPGISPERIWSAHTEQKQRMVDIVHRRMFERGARLGVAPERLRELTHVLRPDALLVGFARRFATYKRAHLLFSDPGRLLRLLLDPQRPVQVIFAGKAHPADHEGQQVIRRVVDATRDMPGSICFVEDYDMGIARALVSGVDVWLNNPVRPMEASGTSGMKAAVNGALNVSIADGWWPEAADGSNGWTIPVDGPADDPADAEALYGLLEHEVVRLFYERDEGGVPRDWVRRMVRSIATIAPAFSATRMVRQYTLQVYGAGVAAVPGES